ncbi:MAG: hypothetical protein P1U77_27060, partial [Rubripirellula sp.]|nr:hypothetical protein [Rubripirellula sp.]
MGLFSLTETAADPTTGHDGTAAAHDLDIYLSNGQVQASIGSSVLSTGGPEFSGANFNQGWHHVLLTFNNDAIGGTGLFVDGTLAGAVASNGDTTDLNFAQLGYASDAAAPWLSGQLDEVRLYRGDINNLPNSQVAALSSRTWKERESGVASLADKKFLQVVDLSNNQITDITPLTTTDRLRWLDLTNNSVASIDPLTGEWIINNGDVGYSETGSAWTSASRLTAFESDYRIVASSNGEAAATYSFTDLPKIDAFGETIEYQIAVTWPAHASRTSNAQWEVVGAVTDVYQRNQQAPPAGETLGNASWEVLGSMSPDENGAISINLTDVDGDLINGNLAVDAVRLSRAVLPELEVLTLINNPLDQYANEFAIDSLSVGGLDSNVVLNPTRLPSEQGWTLDHSPGTSEAHVWSVGAGVLQHRGVGRALGANSDFLYRYSIDDAIDSFDMEFSAQLKNLIDNAERLIGFAFFIHLPNHSFAVRFGDGVINLAINAGDEFLNIDTRSWHDYRITGRADGSFDFYVDGLLRFTGTAVPYSGPARDSEVVFGDPASQVNVDLDISRLGFKYVPDLTGVSRTGGYALVDDDQSTALVEGIAAGVSNLGGPFIGPIPLQDFNQSEFLTSTVNANTAGFDILRPYVEPDPGTSSYSGNFISLEPTITGIEVYGPNITDFNFNATGGTFYGQPFHFANEGGIATMYVEGDLHIGADTIRVYGDAPLSIVVGGSTYIDSDATFDSSASTYSGYAGGPNGGAGGSGGDVSGSFGALGSGGGGEFEGRDGGDGGFMDDCRDQFQERCEAGSPGEYGVVGNGAPNGPGGSGSTEGTGPSGNESGGGQEAGGG